MHRKFAAWLSEHPWRASLCTAFFGVLSMFGIVPFLLAAGAVPVFVLLHKGLRPALNAALAGTIWVGAFVLLLTQSLPSALGTTGTLIWLPLLLAMLLRQSGSLRLCFQMGLLTAACGLALVYLALDEPTARWREFIQSLLDPLQQAGIGLDGRQLDAFRSMTNWGTYATLLSLSVFGAFFLGRWWQSLLEAPGGFGAEYRQLRLGKVLGACALLVVLSGIAFNALDISLPLLDAWIWIAVMGLAFQGLGAVHRLKASGAIGRWWLTAVYVLLIVPFSASLMVVLLTGWGLADNWRGTRAHGM